MSSRYIYHYYVEVFKNGNHVGSVDGILESTKPIIGNSEFLKAKEGMMLSVFDERGFMPDDILFRSLSLLFAPK